MSCKQLLVCLLWLGGQLLSPVWSQRDSVVDVRLINGASFTEGQVEILYQNATEWAPLCDISSSGNKLQYAANLICQRLGYYRLEAETYTVQSMLNTPCISGYQLQCVGSEAALEECGFKDNQCGSMYAGVRCMEDVALLLNAMSYVNNSLININDIGKEEDRSNANRSLVCQTTNQQCCFNSSKGGWYTPNGREVTDVFTMETGLYMSRGEDGTVRLNQPAVGGVAIPSGVFHCEIPDFDNTTQYLFIGIYSNNTGHVVVNDLVYNVPSQTLICTSTGGPATTVTWIKDDIILSTDRRLYEYSQVITDTASATYENRLRIATITTNTVGVYRCKVGNAVSNSTHSGPGVAVFSDGETRLAGGSQDAAIEVYFNGEWQTVCSNLFVEGDTQLLQNVNIRADGVSITASWETPDVESGLEIVSYEVKCSTFYDQSLQEHRIVPSVNINSGTITRLLPLTSYNCCVTAYQNTNAPLKNTATTCMSVTTSVDRVTTTTESLLPCGSSSSITVIPLGAVVGLLFVVLVVIVTVGIPLTYVTAKKRNKADFTIPNTYASQEVHLRNPIYTSNENYTTCNEELKYSTIADPSSRVTLRNTRPSSSTPDSNRYSLQPDQSNKPADQLYDTVADHQSQTELVTSHEHPKPSYAVLENSNKDRPGSELTASVIAYQVVNLASSVPDDEGPLSEDTAQISSGYSTVHNSLMQDDSANQQSSATPPARRSTIETAVPVEYSVPVDSPRFSRAAYTMKPQVTPYQVVELSLANRNRSASLEEPLKKNGSTGLIRNHRQSKDVHDTTPQPYETVKPLQSQ